MPPKARPKPNKKPQRKVQNEELAKCEGENVDKAGGGGDCINHNLNMSDATIEKLGTKELIKYWSTGAKTINPNDMVRPCTPPSEADENKSISSASSSSSASTPIATIRPDLSPEDENRLRILKLFTHENLDPYERLNERLVCCKFYSLEGGELVPDMNIIAGNLIEFSKSPVPIGVTLKCRITRYCDTLNRKLFPSYTLSLLKNESNHPAKMTLMISRERKKTLGSSIHLISVDPLNLYRGRESILAEFHGNLRGSEFTLYDGELSKKTDENHSSRPMSALSIRSFSFGFGKGSRKEENDTESIASADKSIEYREELVSIKYLHHPSSNKLRKIKILLPVMVSEIERLEVQRIGGNHNLAKCTNGLMHGVMEFWSKDPENDQKGEDKHSVKDSQDEQEDLDLELGRGGVKSVKNFQIVHAERDDYVILESGRLSDHDFSLDIRFPLCPLQAFGIALSSFCKRMKLLGRKS